MTKTLCMVLFLTQANLGTEHIAGSICYPIAHHSFFSQLQMSVI